MAPLNVQDNVDELSTHDLLYQRLKTKYDVDYFHDRGDVNDPKREQSYVGERKRIFEYAKSGRILDIGCGTGDFLKGFSPDMWERDGVEISEHASKLAASHGIKIVDLDSEESLYDVVVLRGVLQHLETPLYTLLQCVDRLKPGGLIVFLATPNTRSIVYRLFGDLPMLDSNRNFMLPSDKELIQIVTNFGLELEEVSYPYLGSPYAQPLYDHVKFLGSLFGFRTKFAFWGNMMELFARKPL
jgi:SAM-dependent methyltransferase